MPETRTVALTDAERVNLLLDENQRLRDEIDRRTASARGSLADMTAARDLIAKRREEAIEAGRRQRDDAIVARRAAEAANDALRAALRTAERERVDAQVMHHAAEAECEQLRRELAAVRAGRPSCVYTLSRLVGVAIGTAVVSGVAGAEAVGHVLRGWSW